MKKWIQPPTSLILNSVALGLQGIVFASILMPSIIANDHRQLGDSLVGFYMFATTSTSIWFVVASVALHVKLVKPETTNFSPKVIRYAAAILFVAEILMPVCPIALCFLFGLLQSHMIED